MKKFRRMLLRKSSKNATINSPKGVAMEDRIRAYEKFAAKVAKNLPQTAEAKERLWRYHRATLQDFQHERLVHEIVMFVFVSFTVALMVAEIPLSLSNLPLILALPFHVLTALMLIISACYVKHYYFLENHIQKLSDYNAKFSNFD